MMYTRGSFLYRWCREHGFSEAHIGTMMIRECADYIASSTDLFPKMCDDVYVHVSRVFGRSVLSVERSIRSAIAASACAGMSNADVIRGCAAELRLMDTDYER